MADNFFLIHLVILNDSIFFYHLVNEGEQVNLFYWEGYCDDRACLKLKNIFFFYNLNPSVFFGYLFLFSHDYD